MNTAEFIEEIKKIPLTRRGKVPELLRFKNGKVVDSPRAWERRRKEVADLVIPTVFGGMPKAVAASAVSVENISTCKKWNGASSEFHRLDPVQHDARHITVAGGKEPLSFGLQVWIPDGPGPHPVLVNGDGCWDYLNHEVICMALRRGWMVAQFNRCELARDEKGKKDRGIYRAFPGSYGAISAWAWGYHRVVDALLQDPLADPSRIVITGHSRGGKSVLLAASTDNRIAAVGDNMSGCCGSGSFHLIGEKCERISDIATVFPFWFAEDFGKWAGREAELPFDQHFFESLIAPRPLLIRHALGDVWANQHGAYEMYKAAKKVWALLGAPKNIEFSGRARDHYHEPSDWEAFLDFAENRLAIKR